VQAPGVERAAEHHAVVAVQVPDVRGGQHVDRHALRVERGGDLLRDLLGGAVSGGVGDEDACHGLKARARPARAHPRPSDDPARETTEMDERRLRTLLAAGRSLISELDPDAVLLRLLEVAREVTGARYAAIGVLDERREALERFLTAGVDEETHRRI